MSKLNKKDTTVLLDQRNALTSYLDALLKEVSWDEEVEHPEPLTTQPELPRNTHDVETIDGVAPLDLPVQQSLAPVVEVTQPPSAGDEVVENTEIAVSEEQDSTDKESPEPSLHEPIVEIPTWAEGRFQCLTFTIANMQFAAPLEKLNGIIEWPGAITAIPGHTSWFLGLYRNRDQNVQVVDLAHIVAPANRTQSSSENSRQEPKFILLADDGRLGIVTNAMSTVLTLHADDIHWQNDGPVAFVSGTVKEKMCSIIDIDKLVAHLNEDLGQ